MPPVSTAPPDVLVDADACPVKQEVYRVARRHGLSVTLVANTWMETPLDASITLQVVREGLDAADDWIVDHVRRGDVVVTTDIPLAARCLERGALAIRPNGRRFDAETIGDALATREVLANLRESGVVTGGPPPFGKRDRSRFLEAFEEAIRQAVRLRST